MNATENVFDLEGALAALRGRKNCLIYLHNNPDPDAMASAEGLRLLLEAECGLKATVAHGGIIGRAENRAMVHLLGIELAASRKLNPADFDTLATVDTQPGAGNNTFPEERVPDIVIDHHPVVKNGAAPLWNDIRPDAGATTGIVYGYLKRRGLALDSRLSTALFYGIVSDTLDLGRNATDSEREAYFDLLPKADLAVLSQIRVPDLSFKHYKTLTIALQRALVFGRELVTVSLPAVPYPEIPAELADFLLRAQGVHVSFCTGLFAGDLHLSMRTDGPGLNAGALIRQVAGPLGHAGGHERMAGGLVEQVPEENAAALGESLARRLASLLGLPPEARNLVDLV